ncbi:MAG: lysylphosphatidylglycerol synthase transmembrane domain-containing protein, partial [Gemmatimonadota bacterium]|nr:lysylphosphatidylglycerol synthase transmembrane domain-containing protein [Gemmatimonadota bacterium]
MRFVKHTAAFLITAVFLYLAFKGIDFNQAWEILDADRVHWLPLVAFTLISAIVMWIRGWRWKYFYRPEHEATVWGLTTANFIGFMCNNILPLRIGELVRALMGARKTRAGLSYTVSALFIERVLDSMCLIFCLILGISLAGEGLPGLIVTVGKYMKIVFAGAVVMLLVLRAWPQLLGKTVLPVARAALPERWAAKIERVLHVFTDGLLVLRDRGAMLKITALSIFHWGLIVYSYQLAFQAFSLTGLPWHA